MSSPDVEIERKYLLKSDSWKALVSDSVVINQFYFIDDNDVTCRVRQKGDVFLMTMKIKETEMSSKEYEFPIPKAVFTEFSKRSFGSVSKIRHHVVYEGKLWEIDVFSGKNSGLVLAEIELSNEDEKFALPDFIGVEVTDNMEYRNVNLSK